MMFHFVFHVPIKYIAGSNEVSPTRSGGLKVQSRGNKGQISKTQGTSGEIYLLF